MAASGVHLGRFHRCNLGELVWRTQLQTGSRGLHLPYSPEKFSKCRCENTCFVISKKYSEFFLFFNTLSPSTFAGVPRQTYGLKWLWTHHISFFFDFPGHFEYFHRILNCDQGSRIYTLLGLGIRYLMPRPNHVYIRSAMRTCIYVVGSGH